MVLMSKYKNIKEAVLNLLDKALAETNKPGYGKLSSVAIDMGKGEKDLKLSLWHANGYSDYRGLDTVDRPGISQLMLIGEKTDRLDGGLIPNVATKITKEAGFNLDNKIWDAYKNFNNENIERINPEIGNITVHSEIEKKGKRFIHKFSVFLNTDDVNFLQNAVREQLNKASFDISEHKFTKKHVPLLNPIGAITSGITKE